MSFDFDREIPRNGTQALKYDGRAGYFGTADLQPMWVADMDFAAPEAVSRALEARAAHPIYGYTVAPDSLFDALTAWMKTRHGWDIRREWLMLTPGVVPSINMSVMALTQPGDGVIVQPPVYFPFFSAATETGRRLVQNPLKLEHGRYTMDFDGLERCAAEARLLLLCSPHNPVGRVWTPEELSTLLDIAARHDLVILSDEIHADLVYPGVRHHALGKMTDDSNRIVTAVAPSKTFNIPGLGLSALIVPDAAKRHAIRKVFDTIHLNPANPFGIVAFEAAYREGAAWLEALMAYLDNSRKEASAYIKTSLPELQLVAPEGTYLLWLDCRSLGMPDDGLRHFMIHDAKVGMSPGISFGLGGTGFMRMNIGTQRCNVMAALQQIRRALDQLN